MALRRVDAGGHVKIDGKTLFLGGGLVKQDIAMERPTSNSMRLRYYDLVLGDFTLTDGKWIESDAPIPTSPGVHP